MTFEHSSKNKTFFLVVFSAFFVVGIIAFLSSPVVFQEGDPLPQLKGIARLSFGGAQIVKISDAENKFMTRAENGAEAVKALLKGKGYGFTEQMGSAYLFISPLGSWAVASRRAYSRHYDLWDISENVGQKNESIADELRECLPKSDTASHEKCISLLKLINNYDSCVAAGFSILKSNPPQCALPDGRVFVQSIK